MRKELPAGTTGVTEPIWVANTTSTTGAGLSGLVFNSGGLVCEYRRQGQSTWTSVSLTAGTLGASSGSATAGTIIADGSDTGSYELAPPDNAFATGAKWVVVRLYGAANMLPVRIFYELTATSNQDGTRGGMTALPNANANANGGLPILSSSGTTLNYTVPTVGSVTGGATSANQTSILNAVNAITTNTARGKSATPSFMARPTSSNLVYEVDVTLYTLQGTLEDPDTNTVTVAARDSSGTSHNSQLGSTTMTRLSTGKYKVTYQVNSTDATGEIFFDFSWTVSAVAFALTDVTMVEDAESLSTLNAINTVTSKFQFDGSNNVKSTPQTSVTLAASQDFNNTGQTTKQAATLNAADVTGDLPANVAQWLGAAPNALQFGRVDAYLGATGAVTVTANTTEFNGHAVVLDGNNLPQVDAADWAGTAITTGVPNTAAVVCAANALDGIAAEGAAGGISAINLRQAITLSFDALVGILSGAMSGGGTITIENPGGTIVRIRSTCDGNGNRTVVTLPNLP